MNQKFEADYTHRALTEKIIGVYYSVYNELGYGFLESVYQESMLLALREAGLSVKREVPIEVFFRGIKVGDFRCDLLVNDIVLIELKASRTIDPSFEAQLLNYLRATRLEIGLLFNFGPKSYFKRLAYSNTRKEICVNLRVSAAKGTP